MCVFWQVQCCMDHFFHLGPGNSAAMELLHDCHHGNNLHLKMYHIFSNAGVFDLIFV